MSTYGGVGCLTAFMSISAPWKISLYLYRMCHTRKRLGVRPELDIVISLLCDQSDFLRVEDLPQ